MPPTERAAEIQTEPPAITNVPDTELAASTPEDLRAAFERFQIDPVIPTAFGRHIEFFDSHAPGLRVPLSEDPATALGQLAAQAEAEHQRNAAELRRELGLPASTTDGQVEQHLQRVRK